MVRDKIKWYKVYSASFLVISVFSLVPLSVGSGFFYDGLIMKKKCSYYIRFHVLDLCYVEILETAYFIPNQSYQHKTLTKKSVSKVTFLSVWFVAMCVCVCVCAIATGYTVWARDLKFWHSTLLVTLKKWNFFFFEILIFSRVMPLFRFSP